MAADVDVAADGWTADDCEGQGCLKKKKVLFPIRRDYISHIVATLNVFRSLPRF